MNKKVLLFGMVALLFATTSCKKQETDTSTIRASIVMENDGDKTYLYSDNRVGWSADDVIRVWGASGDQKDYTLTDNSTDPRNGTFSCGHGGVQPGNSYLGFYPTSLFSSRNGDNITFTTSGSQTYVNNTFNNNANPMAAKASEPNLPFKNAFGLLKIELKGNYTVTKIELSDPSNALWGAFTVNAGTMNVTKPARTSTNSVLTMTCSKALDATTASNFYYMVPPGSFSSGFTVNVYRGTNGSTLVDTYTTSTAHTIASNHIKIMQATSTVVTPKVTNLLPVLATDGSGWAFDRVNYASTSYAPSHYSSETNRPTGNTFVIETSQSQVEGFVKSANAISYTNGHQYYLRWMSRKEANITYNGILWNVNNNGPYTAFTQDVYWPIDEAHRWVSIWGGSGTVLWETNSLVFTQTATGSSQIRFDINNATWVMHHYCFADAMLIDLTADYANQGFSIPTKAQLDSKPYFYGQRDITSISGSSW